VGWFRKVVVAVEHPNQKLGDAVQLCQFQRANILLPECEDSVIRSVSYGYFLLLPAT